MVQERPAIRSLIAAILLVVGGVSWANDSRQVTTTAEGLYAHGMGLMAQGALDEALQQFEQAIEADPDHTPSHVGIGNVWLEKAHLKEAEAAFRKALRVEDDYAPALAGLGRVFLATPKSLRWAIKYLKRATVVSPGYTEAYYYLAEAYHRLGSTKELQTYQDLVSANPRDPDGWFQLGRIYRNGIQDRYRDPEKAVRAYRTQLEANPQHLGAREELGEVLAAMDSLDAAADVLQAVVDTPSVYQRKALVALAGVCQSRRQYGRAESLFETYIQQLDPDDRAVFYDLSLVSDASELQRLQQTYTEGPEELSARFWAARDPSPVTEANERWIEHCRRVAYARERFGEFESPWDDRGEVYVRYGKPDHISSSQDIRFETEPKVVAVKERLMMMAGRAVGAMVQAREGSVGDAQVGPSGPGEQVIGSSSAIRRQIAETGHYVTVVRKGGDYVVEVAKAAGAGGSGPTGTKITDNSPALLQTGSILGWPVYPVLDMVWEYWIYTDVGPGIEVTYTQPYTPGPFHYAEPPHGIGADDRSIELTWQRMNPRVVVDAVAAGTPQLYRPEFADKPLDFFFDSARFRGADGRPALEVYYGIPEGGLAFTELEGERRVARAKLGAVLTEQDLQATYRADGERLLAWGTGGDTVRAYFPQVLRMAAPPGHYRLAVQVLEAGTGRSQVYNQDMVVAPYGQGYLRLSDIQLASDIGPVTDERFRKGDIQVVPNPTRHYAYGQPVFVYYEIYNLERDAFGTARYRVNYRIESTERGSVVGRIVSGIGRLLGMETDVQGSVSIEYEQRTETSDDRCYLGIDLSSSQPGQCLLRLEVEDLVAQRTATSAASFTIGSGD